MKIDANIVQRMAQLERKLNRFRAAFSGFIEGAKWLKQPNSPLKGIELQTSSQNDYLDVFFAGMCIRFLLLISYGEDGEPRGRVVCTRLIQGLSDKRIEIGCFLFSGQGMTDFEVDEGGDPIEMEYHAGLIVLNYIDQAIKAPLHDVRHQRSL